MLASDVTSLLDRIGVAPEHRRGMRVVRSPLTGETIANVEDAGPQRTTEAIALAETAFRQWRQIPPPQRGELVRLLGHELRAGKDALGRLVTIEAGKIISEGRGEVQEMIDICDFAVGLSRQL